MCGSDGLTAGAIINLASHGKYTFVKDIQTSLSKCYCYLSINQHYGINNVL